MEINSSNSANNSFASLSTTISPEMIDHVIERNFLDTIEIYILSICFVIGAPLNLISFYKLSKSFRQSKKCPSSSRSQQSSGSGNSQINLLRIHLNIADLMTLFIYTTAQIGWLLTTQWLGGDFLCRIIKFFYTFVFYLTSFVIVCIAVDRVFGAYKLSSFKASKKAFLRCKKMLCIAWGVACLLSLPQLYIFGVVSPPDMPGFRQCAPIWMSMKSHLEHQAKLPEATEEERIILWHEYLAIGRWERAYNITHLLFVFWFPAFAIVISYISVLCILKSFSRPSKAAFKDLKIKNTIISMIYNGRNRRSENSKFVASVTSLNGIQNDPSTAGVIVTTPCLNTQECHNIKEDDAKSLILLEETEKGKILRRSISAESKPLSPVSFEPMPSKEAMKSALKPTEQSKVGSMAMQTIAIARHKTKKQAAFILIAYLTLWTPYNLFAIINIFIPTDSRGYFLNRIMDFTPFLNSLIVVNSLINPLIYGVFDDKVLK